MKLGQFLTAVASAFSIVLSFPIAIQAAGEETSAIVIESSGESQIGYSVVARLESVDFASNPYITWCVKIDGESAVDLAIQFPSFLGVGYTDQEGCVTYEYGIGKVTLAFGSESRLTNKRLNGGLRAIELIASTRDGLSTKAVKTTLEFAPYDVQRTLSCPEKISGKTIKCQFRVSSWGDSKEEPYVFEVEPQYSTTEGFWIGSSVKTQVNSSTATYTLPNKMPYTQRVRVKFSWNSYVAYSNVQTYYSSSKAPTILNRMNSSSKVAFKSTPSGLKDTRAYSLYVGRGSDKATCSVYVYQLIDEMRFDLLTKAVAADSRRLWSFLDSRSGASIIVKATSLNSDCGKALVKTFSFAR